MAEVARPISITAQICLGLRKRKRFKPVQKIQLQIISTESTSVQELSALTNAQLPLGDEGLEQIEGTLQTQGQS